MNHTATCPITADRRRKNDYDIDGDHGQLSRLRPVLHFEENDPDSALTDHPEALRYRQAEIALPDPTSYAYPLVLRIDRAHVARALATVLNHVAERLEQSYVADDSC